MADAAAETTERPISVSAFARRHGLSHTAVRDAIEDGRLSASVVHRDGKPPKLLASVADAEWARRTSPAHARAASPRPPLGQLTERATAPDDYRRTLVVEKVVKTRLAQLDLEERQGRLIDAAQAGDAQFEIARLVRNQLQEFPDRLADELALEGDARRVREILAREVEDVLRKLAARMRAAASVRTPASAQGAVSPSPFAAAPSVATPPPAAASTARKSEARHADGP